MLESSKRKKLMQLLVDHSVLLRPDISLSSGKKSSYYFDGKMVALHPEAASLIAKALRGLIGDTSVDAVGGVIIGAVPMLGALSALGFFRTFFIRKELKEHGLSKWIEGQLTEGDRRVVIVDDVATTGGSILEAIKTLEREFPRIEIVKVIVLVDREEGAKENLKKQGYNLETVFTGKELLAEKEKKEIERRCKKAA